MSSSSATAVSSTNQQSVSSTRPQEPQIMRRLRHYFPQLKQAISQAIYVGKGQYGVFYQVRFTLSKNNLLPKSILENVWYGLKLPLSFDSKEKRLPKNQIFQEIDALEHEKNVMLKIREASESEEEGACITPALFYRRLNEQVRVSFNFLIMPNYLISLQEIFNTKAQWTPKDQLRLLHDLFQACYVMHHKALVVHFDIRPANIMFDDQSGRFRVIDYGLARSLEKEGAYLEGQKVADNIKPFELCLGLAGAVSDMYAIGVLVYETVCGRRMPYVRRKKWDVKEKMWVRKEERELNLEQVAYHFARDKKIPHELIEERRSKKLLGFAEFCFREGSLPGKYEVAGRFKPMVQKAESEYSFALFDRAPDTPIRKIVGRLLCHDPKERLTARVGLEMTKGLFRLLNKREPVERKTQK